MDNFGYFELKDAPLIADQINQAGNVVFNYSLDNGTAFVISLFTNYKTLNHLSHGNPFGRLFVGIMFCGYFHFDPKLTQYPDYVGDKLGLREPDAILVAELLNAIFPLIK
jgi:hypothetical protein